MVIFTRRKSKNVLVVLVWIFYLYKTCSICKIEKSLNQFYNKKNKGGSLGKQHCCKSCQKKLNIKYYNNNLEKIRNLRLVWDFDLTLSEYTNLSNEQGNVCKICKKKDKRNLCVDHDHSTGKIRGLLCDNCNRGLGFFKDNPEYLNNAILYLSPVSLSV